MHKKTCQYLVIINFLDIFPDTVQIILYYYMEESEQRLFLKQEGKMLTTNLKLAINFRKLKNIFIRSTKLETNFFDMT